VKPEGSFQAISGGNPASPGLRQYTCQPGCISRRSATQTVSPAAIEPVSATRLALTGSAMGGATAALQAPGAATPSPDARANTNVPTNATNRIGSRFPEKFWPPDGADCVAMQPPGAATTQTRRHDGRRATG